MATLGNEEVGTSKYDLNAIWVMMILISIGIINLYSATHASTTGEAQFWKQQLVWFGIGSICSGIAYSIHYRVLERFAYLAYAANIVLLLAVLVKIGRAHV